MWDFADNAELAKITADIYEQGGIVSAVCHGPAGLVNVKLSNGKYLVDGKKINAFTNEEETIVKLDKVVPFLLESTLIARGAKFEKSEPWQRRNHNVKCVARIATMACRVCQVLDERLELQERTGPAMCQNKWNGGRANPNFVK